MDLLVGAGGQDLDQALLIRAEALGAETQPGELQDGTGDPQRGPGGPPCPYPDGIFNLLGITVGWGPHQADNQPLELARQLVLEVGDEVLEEEDEEDEEEEDEDEEGAGTPLAPQQGSISQCGHGSWVAAPAAHFWGTDLGWFLPLPSRRGTCRPGRSPRAACCSGT